MRRNQGSNPPTTEIRGGILEFRQMPFPLVDLPPQVHKKPLLARLRVKRWQNLVHGRHDARGR